MCFCIDPHALCEFCNVTLPPGRSQYPYVCVCSYSTHTAVPNRQCKYRPTLSYQRLRTEEHLSDEELYARIRRTVPNKHDSQVLESFLIFNKLVHR